MDSNEAYVRARWEPSAGFRYLDSSTGLIEVIGKRYTFNTGQFGEADFWQGAYAFTIEREEQIRQVKEEIAVVLDCRDDATGQREKVFGRTLSRLQSALADLTAGMVQP